MAASTVPASPPINGLVSHWYRQLGELPQPRGTLPGPRDADVCIVGAGMTGLWTAYYLKRADPSLRITVLEAEFAGFGASGRNGGWLSGLLPASRKVLAKRYGRSPVLAMQAAMNAAVDEVLEVDRHEGLGSNPVKGGTLRVAVTPAQVGRLEELTREDHRWGVPEVQLLTAAEATDRVRVAGVRAAAWTPHCARLQPAALVRGLAETVERMGVTIYENAPVTRIEQQAAVTPRGAVTAPIILRTTEGFTAGLEGHRRTWLPMNSSMIVTEPLSPRTWQHIGWNHGETLGDTAHAHMYAQRTDDDRIAFGGRGIPYRFGSRTDSYGRTQQRTVEQLREVLDRMLPQTRGAHIEHAWCGVLAVPRDWCATVGLDAATGLGWAGGYVGHGVTSTNLAGRTLRDLVLRRETDLTALPWVGHQPGNWEPEPLRWLGVRGLYLAYGLADRHEARGLRRTSSIATVANLISRRP